MNQDKRYPDWFLWLWEKGAVLFFGVGLVLLVLIMVVAAYLDHRLEQVESRISYVPPRSYEAPDPSAFPVGDTDLDALPVKQRVYVPIYSHVYYQGGAPYLLETTLSIRNTDPEQPLFVGSVDYFDTSGKLVKSHLEKAIQLGPLQTIEFLVERRDSTGGSGANFVVDWLADSETTKPLVEAVMVGTVGTQGICFSRTGIEIPRRGDR